MFRGLYTAVSAMQTNQKQLDIAANNMANINTTGFKKDVMISETFPEVLIKKINGSLPTDPVKADGALEIIEDGQGLHVRTERGFFTVESPMGISYSREVRFAPDEEGYLKTYRRDIEGKIDTSEGNFVLDSNGQRIRVDGDQLNITEDGQLTVNGAGVGNLIYKPPFNTIGTINSGRRLEKVHTNFMQGSFEETGNNLDLAIKGEGFFKVLTPEGEMYTKNGKFSLNSQGIIVTEEGYPLLGQEGAIMVDGSDFQVGTFGEIIVDGGQVDRIDLTHISNVEVLRKYGESYFVVEDNIEVEELPFQGEVLQGFLENSNINAIREMVDMISLLRTYESNQRVVKAYDDILQRAVNDIGKL